MSKQQVKIVKLGKHFGVQLKYSDSLPAFVDCQKDSESTGENGTQVKPVLLAVEIFAVYVGAFPLFCVIQGVRRFHDMSVKEMKNSTGNKGVAK